VITLRRLGLVAPAAASAGMLRRAVATAPHEAESADAAGQREHAPAGDGDAPTPARADRRSSLGRQDTVGLIGLAVFCAALVAVTWGTWGDLSMDSGYDLLASVRMNHGDYPYIDYVYIYGPLGPALLSQVLDVFGDTVDVAFAFGAALALAIVGATFALARSLVGLPASLIVAAITATAAFSSENNSFVMPHTFSAPLAVLLVMGALLAAIGVARGAGRSRLLLAGACAGAVTLTRPEFAAAVIVALGAWLVLRIADAPDRRAALRDAGIVALPLIAIPAIVYGLALTRISVANLVTENLYPVEYLRQAGSVIIDQHAPLTLASFAKLGALLGIYAAGAGALVAAGVAIAHGGRLRTLALLAVGGAALAFVAAVALRPDFVRFKLEYVYAWVPLGAWIAVALLLLRFRRREGRWSAPAQIELLTLVATAVVMTKGYSDFFPFPNPVHPQDAAYALPFVAVFLAWLHMRELPRGRAPVALLGAGWLALLLIASTVLVTRDAGKETVTVVGAHGSMTALPADGAAYQGAIDAIQSLTRPGEPVLLAPQMTALYVMSGATNPLAQISLLPGTLADDSAERAAIRKLEASGVRLVITDRAAQTTYAQGAFGETYDKQLGSWIKTNFSRAAVLRGAGPNPRTLDVWKRREL
jgi:hypothetical protein